MRDFQKGLFCFILVLLFHSADAQDPVGKWTGVIKFQGSSLKIVFNIAKDSMSYRATMDSPTQGAKGIPVEVVRLDTIVVLRIKAAGIAYEARWIDNNHLQGTFSQSGLALPLGLTRSEDNLEKTRYQEPKLPVPYLSEELKIKSQSGGEIAGTLTFPSGKSNYPIIILISGSGAQNRNSEVFAHKPFLIIADHLTRNGYAVFRYDDRGVGGSTGNFSSATSDDLASDALDIIKYFKTKEGINKRMIGLLGHSEGGLIAPLVYQSSKDISFMIFMAAPGVKCREVLLKQQYDIGRASGADEKQLARAKEINTHIYDQVAKIKDLDKLESDLRNYLKQELIKDNPSLSADQLDNFIINQLALIKSPWFRFFITYDPQPALRKIKSPVLAINGGKDLQVSADANLKGIEQALSRGGNRNFSIKQIENVNHLFQECETGNISEYAIIEQTISPKVLDVIVAWIDSLK